MTHFRLSTRSQLSAYRYAYGDKNESGYSDLNLIGTMITSKIQIEALENCSNFYNSETKREKLGPYYSLKPNCLWPDIVKEVKEINNNGNVPYFYDSYSPTDNDTKIKYDNLNPNYYNNLIPVVGPIKKIKYKQGE